MDNYIVVGDPELAPDVPPSGEVSDVWKAMGYLGAKNLIPYPYYHSNGHVHNGITFTVNDDFSVTANGTATAQAEFVFIAYADNRYLPIGDYILSGISGGSYGTYLIQANVRASQSDFAYDGERTITVTDNTYAIRLSFKVQSGYVADNITVRPMLRLADDADSTYQPYAKTNKQLTDDVSKINSDLSVKPSYVGMIDISTTNDTLAKVRAIYGSNTNWIQHTGYVLRGATSGVVANSATKTGGNDSVALVEKNIPSHTHSTPNHTHTLSVNSGGNWAFENTALGARTGSSTNVSAVTNVSASASGSSRYRIGNNSYVGSAITTLIDRITHGGHSHGLTWTSSGGGTSGSYGSTGGQSNVATLPNYKSVYIWERTA